MCFTLWCVYWVPCGVRIMRCSGVSPETTACNFKLTWNFFKTFAYFSFLLLRYTFREIPFSINTPSYFYDVSIHTLISPFRSIALIHCLDINVYMQACTSTLKRTCLFETPCNLYLVPWNSWNKHFMCVPPDVCLHSFHSQLIQRYKHLKSVRSFWSTL